MEPHIAETPDVIALVAPANRNFLSLFFDHFTQVAVQNDALLCYVQQSAHESMTDTLRRLRQKGIMSAVVWADYDKVDIDESLQLLQGGMNLVFLDVPLPSDRVDNVYLDNHHAIQTMYAFLKESGKKAIAYVTRQDCSAVSLGERRKAYGEISKNGIIYDIPWNHSGYLDTLLDDFSFDKLKPNYKPDAVICSDGEIGTALKKIMEKNRIDDIALVTLDDYPEAEEYGITVYAQPYKAFASAVYKRLQEQNSEGWSPATIRLQGKLIIRE